MVPPLQTKVTIAGTTKFKREKISSGHFWYTNFWIPDPPPPPREELRWGIAPPPPPFKHDPGPGALPSHVLLQFQFVDYHSIMAKGGPTEARFALMALMEIPQQYVPIAHRRYGRPPLKTCPSLQRPLLPSPGGPALSAFFPQKVVGTQTEPRKGGG